MTKATEIELKHPLAPLPEDGDAELAHRLCAALSGWRYREPGIVGEWNRNFRLKTDPGAFFAELLGLKDKAEYLEFRDLLKAHLRFFAADQKRLALLMRAPGGDPEAQCRHAQHAGLIASLIEIRRAGKDWSAAQAAALRTAAA